MLFSFVKMPSLLILSAAAIAFSSWLSFNNDSAVPIGESQTLLVVVDDKSVSTLGVAPIDRLHVAHAIDRLKKYGAKAVAIKFFYDTSKNSDAALASSMRQIPTLLQYSLDPSGREKINPRAGFDILISQPISGAGFMMPVLPLRSAAHDLGFVNLYDVKNQNKVELVGQSDGHSVPSLQLEILEAVANKKAITSGHGIKIGNTVFELDEHGRTSCEFMETAEPKKISISDVLNNSIDVDAVKNKVVVIGYDRQDSPRFSTSIFKSIPVHEYFYRQVVCLVGRLN